MNYSLYIHIPFCLRRCHYCDFITYTGQSAYIGAYVDALIHELRIVNRQKPDIQLHSVYFGGGTPSLIPSSYYAKILEAIDSFFLITSDCEISIEANPNGLSFGYLKELRSLGFNRLSLGVQSMNTFDLSRLDRLHSVWDVLASLANARKAGFNNLNLDLIFGLPWQDLNDWQTCLLQALKLHPEHFSIYSLIIEPGTPLFTWYQRGLIMPQNQDLEADMFEFVIDTLNQAGFDHYEISNWAKRDSKHDYRCRHNLQYWLGYPYLGIGVGAHGFASGYRTVNTPTIHGYIRKNISVEAFTGTFPHTPSQAVVEKIDTATQMMDFMIMGLRLVKVGVSTERFTQLFGKLMKEVFQKEIDTLIGQGLVKWTDKHQTNLILTKRGLMVANHVFMEFV